jgi:hypothetical protein
MISLHRITVGISSFFAQKSSIFLNFKMKSYLQLMKVILIIKTNHVKLSISNHVKKLYAKMVLTLISIKLIGTIVS